MYLQTCCSPHSADLEAPGFLHFRRRSGPWPQEAVLEGLSLEFSRLKAHCSMTKSKTCVFLPSVVMKPGPEVSSGHTAVGLKCKSLLVSRRQTLQRPGTEDEES